jgi:acetyl-CoA C-acetyltransferase
MKSADAHPRRVAIVSAMRTPIGSFGGCFRDVAAFQLAATAIKAALEKAAVIASEIGAVVLGNVLQMGQGQNPARLAAVLADIPYRVPAMTLNMVCGSGLKAITIAANEIRLGNVETAIAGGMESMSSTPYLLQDHRWGKRFGESGLVDPVVQEALWDAFYDCHMASTAEHLATTYKISREDQDVYAHQSQRKFAVGLEAGDWKTEIAPVTVVSKKDSTVVSHDEHPRPSTSLQKLSQLRPAFSEDGSITAGNASGLNDGAAVVVLASEDYCSRKGVTPMAWMGSNEEVGVDPMLMGIAPSLAIRRLLERSQTKLGDYQAVEINEAFAAQVLAVSRDLHIDPATLNPNGGAIAMGHPIGASGARIIVTLAHHMHRRQINKGLAAICIGGGMGIAQEVLRA